MAWSHFARYLAPASRVATVAEDAALEAGSRIAAGLATAFPPAQGWRIEVRPLEWEAAQVRVRRGLGEGVDLRIGAAIREDPAPDAGRRWLGVEAMAASRVCAMSPPRWLGPLAVTFFAALAVFAPAGRRTWIPAPFGWLTDLPFLVMLPGIGVLGILWAVGVCALVELVATRGRGNPLRPAEALRRAGEAAAVAAGADPATVHRPADGQAVLGDAVDAPRGRRAPG